MDIELIKRELEKIQDNCNEEAKKDWKDERIYTIESFILNKKEEILITISIGRWDTTFHDIIINDEGWKIIKQSEKNHLLDIIVDNFIIPTIIQT